jgi:hypothetical protein
VAHGPTETQSDRIAAFFPRRFAAEIVIPSPALSAAMQPSSSCEALIPHLQAISPDPPRQRHRGPGAGRGAAGRDGENHPWGAAADGGGGRLRSRRKGESFT